MPRQPSERSVRRSRRVRSVVLPAFAVGAVIAGLTAIRGGAPESLELTLLDVRSAEVARRNPSRGDVVLVGVDEETVRLAGGVHPLPRSALAAIVEEARAAGARGVVLDYILQDPLEGALADENVALERAIAGGDVVIAAALTGAGAEDVAGRGAAPDGAARDRAEALQRRHARDLGGRARPERFTLSPPLHRFALAAAALGGVSQQPASNGRIYALRHVYPAEEGDYPSLPLAAAVLALGADPPRLGTAGLRIGQAVVPVAADGRVYLRWYGPGPGTHGGAVYPEVSAATLLQARLAREGAGESRPSVSLTALRGRIVIVCQTMAGTKDKQPTPVNASALGAEVLANATENLVRGEAVRRLPRWADVAIAILLAVASAVVVALATHRALRPWAVVAVSAAATAALVLGWWRISIVALEHGVWVAALAPMAGMLLAVFAADLRLFGMERRDRRFVHDALGRYTSPALVETLVASPELLDRFGGTRQELTVYFCDIRGFTSFSEGMPPEKLVEFLNEYLTALTEIVERHGGYVDKYIGDAIMAVWGAPAPAADHALRACTAAVQMRDRIVALGPSWRERYGLEIAAGAGINTGPMVAGNIGSRRKTNYTVLGESVNVASRLEGANKVYGTSILLGDRTRAAAGDGVVTRPLDLLRVKGQRQALPVFELVGLSGHVTPEQRDRLASWEKSVAAYRAARFDLALAGFEDYERLCPGDVPASLYVARCREQLRTPAAGWDAVHVLYEK